VSPHQQVSPQRHFKCEDSLGTGCHNLGPDRSVLMDRLTVSVKITVDRHSGVCWEPENSVIPTCDVTRLDGSHMAIVKRLAMANRTHTWWRNMPPLRPYKSYKLGCL